MLKSATISFGQALVPEVIDRAMEVAEACDLLLAVGSTLAGLPGRLRGAPGACQRCARVVIVNAEPTAMDVMADAVLRGPISELLPRLVAPRE